MVVLLMILEMRDELIDHMVAFQSHMVVEEVMFLMLKEVSEGQDVALYHSKVRTSIFEDTCYAVAMVEDEDHCIHLQLLLLARMLVCMVILALIGFALGRYLDHYLILSLAVVSKDCQHSQKDEAERVYQTTVETYAGMVMEQSLVVVVRRLADSVLLAFSVLGLIVCQLDQEVSPLEGESQQQPV